VVLKVPENPVVPEVPKNPMNLSVLAFQTILVSH
jgi:hypothetical protein